MPLGTFVGAMGAIVHSRSIERFWGILQEARDQDDGVTLGGLLQL